MWGRLVAFFGTLFTRGRSAAKVAGVASKTSKAAAGILSKTGLKKAFSWIVNAAFAFLIGKDIYDIFADGSDNTAGKCVPLNSIDAASILSLVLPDPSMQFSCMSSIDRIVNTKLSGDALRRKIQAVRSLGAHLCTSESPIENGALDVVATVDTFLTQLFENRSAQASELVSSESIREISYRYQKYRWSMGCEDEATRQNGIEILKYLYGYDSLKSKLTDDDKSVMGIDDDLAHAGSLSEICDQIAISCEESESNARAVLFLVCLANTFSTLQRLQEGKEVAC